jgi:hypothetical protein
MSGASLEKTSAPAPARENPSVHTTTQPRPVWAETDRLKDLPVRLPEIELSLPQPRRQKSDSVGSSPCSPAKLERVLQAPHQHDLQELEVSALAR